MANWIDIISADTMPPEGEVVMTRDSGGHEQALKREGRLFYFPDMSMYVYYTPRAWRELTDAECDAEIAKIEANAAAQAESSRRSIAGMRRGEAKGGREGA